MDMICSGIFLTNTLPPILSSSLTSTPSISLLDLPRASLSLSQTLHPILYSRRGSFSRGSTANCSFYPNNAEDDSGLSPIELQLPQVCLPRLRSNMSWGGSRHHFFPVPSYFPSFSFNSIFIYIMCSNLFEKTLGCYYRCCMRPFLNTPPLI
jgi:hypothetical protein